MARSTPPRSTANSSPPQRQNQKNKPLIPEQAGSSVNQPVDADVDGDGEQGDDENTVAENEILPELTDPE